MLDISYHSEGFTRSGSTVYVLALDGGEAKLGTEKTEASISECIVLGSNSWKRDEGNRIIKLQKVNITPNSLDQ